MEFGKLIYVRKEEDDDAEYYVVVDSLEELADHDGEDVATYRLIKIQTANVEVTLE